MFWNTFAKLCVDAGKSPNTVAAECGVKSSGTVTGWKNGAIPRPSVLRRIAEYFGVTVAELVGHSLDGLEYDKTVGRYVTPYENRISANKTPIDYKKAAPSIEDGLQNLKDDERVLLEHYRSMTETDRDMMRDLARRLTHAD